MVDMTGSAVVAPPTLSHHQIGWRGAGDRQVTWHG